MRDVQELLSRQMTRKEFIRLLGVALVTMLGANNFIAALDKYAKRRDGQSKTAVKNADHGFGSRKFGV